MNDKITALLAQEQKLRASKASKTASLLYI
ncbi:hypothetical protein FlaCF_2713 [Flavobacterium tructae]